MRGLPMVMLVLAGCFYTEDDFGNYTIDVAVTSDVPLHRVDVWYSGPGGDLEPAPITPGRRARGEVDLEIAQVLGAWFETVQLNGERRAQLSIEQNFTPTVLVIGYQRDAGGAYRVVGAAEAAAGGHTYHLTAELAASVEVWGDGEARCARVANGPHYFVTGRDADCDGIGEEQDCNDLDHCDLDAPTAAERAGCETARCEPCLDQTPGACALGNRAVCRDQGPGVEPAVTCDGDAACGAVTCLPESTCRTAFDDCFGDWPDIDPRECLTFRWGEGVASADAIQCALPAEPPISEPIGGQLCPGGSTVEAALPFADCSDAEAVIGATTYENATAVIVPPCTVRITLTQTPVGDVYLRARGVLVTFAAGGTSTSARFQLVANPGTCGSVGTCVAAPDTSFCTR